MVRAALTGFLDTTDVVDALLPGPDDAAAALRDGPTQPHRLIEDQTFIDEDGCRREWPAGSIVRTKAGLALLHSRGALLEPI